MDDQTSPISNTVTGSERKKSIVSFKDDNEKDLEDYNMKKKLSLPLPSTNEIEKENGNELFHKSSQISTSSENYWEKGSEFNSSESLSNNYSTGPFVVTKDGSRSEKELFPNATKKAGVIFPDLPDISDQETYEQARKTSATKRMLLKMTASSPLDSGDDLHDTLSVASLMSFSARPMRNISTPTVGRPSKIVRRFIGAEEVGQSFDQLAGGLSTDVSRDHDSIASMTLSTKRALAATETAKAEVTVQAAAEKVARRWKEGGLYVKTSRPSNEAELSFRQQILKKMSPQSAAEAEDPLSATPMPLDFPIETPPLMRAHRSFDMGSEYRCEYNGTLGSFGTPEGFGKMTRPFQVEYEGEFHDGKCHGVGALHFPNGAVVRGIWVDGHLTDPSYISPDGYEYHPDGSYCEMPDRRYYTEMQRGLRPGGRSQLTNEDPPRPVPPACYDAGDGIFDPRRNCVYDPLSLEVLRVPTTSEMEWIKKNCRKGWDENVGYRPDLFENWQRPPSAEASAALEAAEEEEKEERKSEEEEEEGRVEERAEEEEEKERKWMGKEVRTEALSLLEVYPPVALQDVILDAPVPLDLLEMLFPETEGAPPAALRDRLMVPVETALPSDSLRVKEEEAVKGEEGEEEAKEEEEEKIASKPSTPRLSLDETAELYKGPWRNLAHRFLPALRQHLDEDRRAAAQQWQTDLMQLLSERGYSPQDSTAGARATQRMSLGAGRALFPPGLEERARRRRAEREEREREEREREEEEEQQRAAADANRSSRRDTEGQRRRTSSLLPPAAASVAPKGGRESSIANKEMAKSVQLNLEALEMSV